MKLKAFLIFSPALYFIYLLLNDYNSLSTGKIICILIVILALLINLINDLKAK
jgi:hypothetical protein